MPNKLKVTHTDDGRRRVAVQSPGERDLSVVVDRDELQAMLNEADEAQGSGDPGEPATEPEPSGNVGEPSTTTPDAAAGAEQPAEGTDSMADPETGPEPAPSEGDAQPAEGEASSGEAGSTGGEQVEGDKV